MQITRTDILKRDLADIVFESGRCVVGSGTLADPYTGTIIHFVRGVGTSSAIQIDHVVALGNVWVSGGQQLSAADRVNIANDPLNLLAVDGPANDQKQASNAASWLAPNKSYRCAYVARQVAVKAKYHLSMTPAERDAIARVLTACPAQLAPTEQSAPIKVVTRTSATPPPTTAKTPAKASVKPPATKTTAVGGAAYYKNCAAVRAAGKAPLHKGDPGYRSGLDRDGDGVACE